MKLTKRSILTLVALVAAIILPACGKSKSSTNGLGVAGYNSIIPGVNPGSSIGCLPMNNPGSSGMQFTISGKITTGTTVFNGNVPVTASGPAAISAQYSRINQATGDRIDFQIVGDTLYGVVSLAAGTVGTVNYYGGGQGCVQGVSFGNVGIKASDSWGNVYGTFTLVMGNGYLYL